MPDSYPFPTKIDSKGHITVPKGIREALGLKEGDWVEAVVSKRREGPSHEAQPEEKEKE